MQQRTVTAHVTGIVFEVAVNSGDTVSTDDTLMIIESMKMHYAVDSPCAGTVAEVLVCAKDTVAEGQSVLKLDCETP